MVMFQRWYWWFLDDLLIHMYEYPASTKDSPPHPVTEVLCLSPGLGALGVKAVDPDGGQTCSVRPTAAQLRGKAGCRAGCLDRERLALKERQ